MSIHRKKTVAAITAALLHHERMTAAATIPAAAAEPAATPLPLAARGQPQTAWSFSGRYEHMAQRVQRQLRRAG